MRPHLSVAIPTSDMPDKDVLFKRCLDSLWMQTFQNFEVIVTDNSEDDVIENICKEYGIKTYYRNPNKGMAQNTNEAIRRSKGELIKILYMDDFLSHRRSLLNIVNNFEGQWLVTACTHHTLGENFTKTIHYAKYSPDIHLGNNTIGGPSVMTIKNKNPLMFDESMTWLLDCDYYRRMFDQYGEPVILRDINVVIGLHPHQATHTMGDERKLQEYQYINNKYING